MKKIQMILRVTIIFALILCGYDSAFAQTKIDTTIVSGTYAGFDMYMQNPRDGQCIVGITINEKQVDFPKGQSAFLIPLTSWGSLTKGQDIEIKITHVPNCAPKIINLNQFVPNNNFKFTSFELKKDKIEWSGDGEAKGGKYTIEAYILNRWVEKYTVYSSDKKSVNSYSIPIVCHSGINQYRIRYDYAKGVTFRTPIKKIDVGDLGIDVYPKRGIRDKATFTQSVSWELHDNLGKKLAEGEGTVLDMTEYPKGKVYHVSFDNKTVPLYKR